MEPSGAESRAPDHAILDGVTTAVRFLTTLFAPEDVILFRPIETWTDGGRKQSRVAYRHTVHRAATPELLSITMLLLLRRAEEERLNLFFGACPRVGGQEKYDLAWQIRTVRALWTDIDHVTVDQARERIAKSELPEPSIMVDSGHGVHLYWLLDQPFLITDAGEPPAVETEWLKTPEERKKPRRYIVEDGDRVYLNQRRHQYRLSPQGLHLQAVLAGIAAAVGGDHTTDLSRLLRIPGSFNRKDERNGAVPCPATLVECEATRRYPLSLFEARAIATPEAERERKIVQMPLPRPRKTSPSKGDRLAELIAASAIAAPGGRSEADFAVCCFAVRNGIDKEDAWRQVESIGKFSEQGRRYFERTWENAEYEVRVSTFTKLEKQASRPKPGAAPLHSGNEPPDGDLPAGDQPADQRRPPTIQIDAAITPVRDTMQQITDRLLEAGGCFSRAEQLVVIRDESIAPVLSAAELAGLLNHCVEFYFVDDEGGEYKPLPASYGNTWLNHPGEGARLPLIRLFTRNPVFTEDWRLIAPGYDPGSSIYYAGPEVVPLEGTEHLQTLLKDFCFQTPGDRTNYLGMLLTTLLMPRFIGSKPAVIFNGNQPGLGKTILAQMIAVLRDGKSVETASYNPNDEEFEKRLGSIVRRGTTTIIIDNARGRGRNPRIESACLERSITDPILSYRLLGQSDSIRAENSHIFCLTANSPDVSRDLVTRSVVVNLYHEGNPERRTFSITDPEGYAEEHRLELLGELIGMVERWKVSGRPQASVHSRFNKQGWGTLIGGILAVSGEPGFLANAEEAAAQLDETRREFSDLIATLAGHPRSHWTAGELVEHCDAHGLLQEALGDGSPRSKATRLGVIAGRYVTERFDLADGRTATFHRSEDRNGKVYRVGIAEHLRNV